MGGGGKGYGRVNSNRKKYNKNELFKKKERELNLRLVVSSLTKRRKRRQYKVPNHCATVPLCEITCAYK